MPNSHISGNLINMFPQLEYLNIANTIGVHEICSTKLTFLNASSCFEIRSILCPNLVDLSLNCTEFITNLGSLTRLTNLSIFASNVANFDCPNLLILNADYCKNLLQLPVLPKLKYLSLSGDILSETGIESFGYKQVEDPRQNLLSPETTRYLTSLLDLELNFNPHSYDLSNLVSLTKLTARNGGIGSNSLPLKLVDLDIAYATDEWFDLRFFTDLKNVTCLKHTTLILPPQK